MSSPNLLSLSKGNSPKLSASNSRSSLSIDLENFLEIDAAELVKNFRQSFDELKTKFKKVNVLISGVTGAGKSSLVNAIFGKSLAEVSCGYPVTQHFTKYELPDRDVVIFDSKGLEHGEHESFINDTKDFLKQKGDFVKDCVHVIWYVVNSASARFQPFEEAVCRSLYGGAPIMFLLNKADLSTDQERQNLRHVIEGMSLKNCVGVFDTVSDKARSTVPLKRLDCCPQCGDDDLSVKRRLRVAKCNSCSTVTDLTQPCGLDEIVRATHKIIPKVATEAFISAQVVNFKLKDHHARVVLEEFLGEYEQCRLQSSLLKTIARMLTRLSILWDFQTHGHVYGMQIATSLVNQLTFRDKLLLLMWNQLNTALTPAYTISFGIVWNKCIRCVAKELFYDCCYVNMSPADLENVMPEIVEQAFSELNEEFIRGVVERIERLGVPYVLSMDVEHLHFDDDTVAQVSVASSIGSDDDRRATPITAADFDKQALLEMLEQEHMQFATRTSKPKLTDSGGDWDCDEECRLAVTRPSFSEGTLHSYVGV